MRKFKRRPSSTSLDLPPMGPHGKRWKGQRYKRWEPSLVKAAVIKPPTEQELMEAVGKGGTLLRVKQSKDKRECQFCYGRGDGATDGPSR